MYQEIFDQPETYESHFEQEACRNMLVPSMLIHPLVENSLKYCGSDGARGKANIRISAKHTENCWSCALKTRAARSRRMFWQRCKK